MTHKQKVLELLRDGKPHTHMELYRLGCVAHSRVADLRRDGWRIACTKEMVRGERVSVYRLQLDESAAPRLAGSSSCTEPSADSWEDGSVIFRRDLEQPDGAPSSSEQLSIPVEVNPRNAARLTHGEAVRVQTHEFPRRDGQPASFRSGASCFHPADKEAAA